jgi:hypothetical protein
MRIGVDGGLGLHIAETHVIDVTLDIKGAPPKTKPPIREPGFPSRLFPSRDYKER